MKEGRKQRNETEMKINEQQRRELKSGSEPSGGEKRQF